MSTASGDQVWAAAPARSSPARACTAIRSSARAPAAHATSSAAASAARARVRAGLALESRVMESCMVASSEEVGGGERELEVAVGFPRGAVPGAEAVVPHLPAGGGPLGEEQL